MSLKSWIVKKAVTGKLPKWVYSFIGRQIAGKLDLTEDKMSELVDTKKWYQSKSILNAIVIVIIGTYETVRMSLAPQFNWNIPAIPEFVYVILGAIGIYTRKIADTKIG